MKLLDSRLRGNDSKRIMTSLAQNLDDKRLIVCCGSGGVGKTTTSAALGLHAARKGKRVLVLTVDPAKRLANALGLDQLTDRPQLISIPGKPKGSLHAAQLDVKRTFDGIIERFAPDDETREAIMSNALYEHLSSMIAGSQEYMAMEKLYELAHEDDWDLIVLDTPPARNALDFLDAPQKMVRAITDSILKFVVRPSLKAGQIGERLFGGISKRVIKQFERFGGVQFMHEVFDLVHATVSLMDGFGERAKTVEELLKKDTTAFLIITSPRVAAITDAHRFIEKLDDYGVNLAGCIINRVHPAFAKSSSTLDRLHSEIATSGDEIALAIVDNARRYQTLADVDTHEVKLLNGIVPHVATVPLFAEDVCDVKALKRIAEHITA